MVIEHVVLHVRPGQEADFEAAMIAAQPLIAASPGFIGCEVYRGAEQVGTYLLLVRWDTIAAHRDGFRQSARYGQWREALHHFYDPLPRISYFGDNILS